MEKQFVVLGLGIFGSTLVKTLSQYGREVIAIDNNPITKVTVLTPPAVPAGESPINIIIDIKNFVA